MPLKLNSVRDLSRYDRLKFYDHWLDELSNAVWPDRYNRDKRMLKERIESLKNEVIDGRV